MKSKCLICATLWAGILIFGLGACSTIRLNFTHVPKISRIVAEVPLGKQLKILVNPDGKMALGVVFTTADDPDGNRWMLTFKARLDDEELKELPAEVYWNLYLRGQNKYVYEWNKSRALMRAQLKDLQLLAGRPDGYNEIQELLANQGRLIFVVADSEFKPLYAVDIGAFCNESPEYFKNLTNSGKRCSEVTSDDVKKRKYPNTTED